MIQNSLAEFETESVKSEKGSVIPTAKISATFDNVFDEDTSVQPEANVPERAEHVPRRTFRRICFYLYYMFNTQFLNRILLAVVL